MRLRLASYVSHIFLHLSVVETIKVPALGDSISEGVIEEFMKKPGDFVAQDDVIARIETDKVTVDIAAPRAGVIKEYFAEEGDTVEVNADFYSLDTDGKPDPNAGAAAPKKAEPAPAAPASTPAPPKAVSTVFAFVFTNLNFLTS